MNWMISANEKIYQHDKAFNEQYYIDWSSNASFEQGDIVYIYSTAPVSAITHICEVIKVNLKKEEETDDSQYWNTKVDVSDKKKHRIKPLKKLEVPITLDELKKHGLNAAPQGPVRIDNKPELLKFLKDFQVNYYTIAAGEGSTDRTLFYDNSIAALGWKTGDLSNCTSLEEAMKLSGENKLEAGYKMAWMLKHIKKGDVLYLKEGINKLIARGVVTREYYYVEDKYSSRIGVNWELIETIVLPNNLRMSQHTLNRLREDTKQFIDNYNNEGENIMIKPIQKIYIGPPGSGKSYKCKNLENVTRIVFHPEYENSDFIGSLLPVTNNGNVTYDFVPGPFAKILKKALNNSNMQYNLLIEEMTRGNCAAIFGEVFQLLDRDKETGNSQYAINHNYLEEYLNVENIILPSNLNIIGTVNSSDQNVFPMDTAFKRRFKLEYVKPIEDNFEKDDFEILGINWSKLCKNINRLICNSEHLAEDKQIGFYFINKPNNQIEMVENIQKLCIYLWHDVDKFIHETNKKILNHKNYNNFGDFTTNVINFSSKLENIFSTSIVKQLNYSEDIENEPS